MDTLLLHQAQVSGDFKRYSYMYLAIQFDWPHICAVFQYVFNDKLFKAAWDHIWTENDIIYNIEQTSAFKVWKRIKHAKSNQILGYQIYYPSGRSLNGYTRVSLFAMRNEITVLEKLYIHLSSVLRGLARRHTQNICTHILII